MKHKAGIVLTSIFLTVFIFSCSSLGKSEQQQISETNRDSAVSNTLQLPEGWKQDVEITHEGSRSQGSISRLFYRYNEIPEVFNRIIIGKNIFEYNPMKNIWDESGYIHVGITSKCDKTAAINSTELKRGWYFSSELYIKAGTPVDWVWASAGKLEARIAPGFITDYVNLYSLKTISAAPELLKIEE